MNNVDKKTTIAREGNGIELWFKNDLSYKK